MKSTASKATVAQPKRNASFFSKDKGDNFFGRSHNKSPFFSSSNSGCVQTKLTVGKPNDKYEREADAVADTVVQRMSTSERAIPGENAVQQKPITSVTPVVHRKCAECEQEEKLQKKEEEKNEELPLQRKPIFESNAEPEDDKPLQRKCEACAEEEGEVHRKENQSTQPAASSSIESQLNRSKGGGSPLAPNVNASMSNAFGRDLSQVRVHSDSNAAEMSKALNAQAFTHGQDIYFNSGKYDTESNTGKHLLAHELTHTIQQRSDTVQKKGSPKDDKEELIPAKTANPQDLQKAGLQKGKQKGYITRSGSKLKIYLDNLFTKKYLKEEDTSFLKRPAKLPKPSDERKTKQIQEWKKKVKQNVEDELMDNYSKNKKDTESEDLSLTLLTRKQTGAIGNLKQLTGEAAIPFWSHGGRPKVFDVEHMVDWQISFETADSIENLILLDRSYNRKLGNQVRKNIHDHIQAILDHYRKTYSQIPLKAETSLASSDVFVNDFRFEGEELDKNMRYKVDDLLKKNTDKDAVFTTKKILVKDAKIPDGMFLLKTSNSRAGYLIPYNRTETIGAWRITSEFDKKTKELTSLMFELLVQDDKKVFVEREIKAKGKDLKKLKVPFEKEKNLVYKVSPVDLKQQYGLAFKEMYGEIKHASPIQFDEPVVDGLDVSITGKVIPTLSFLKDVDIRFGAQNGEFYIQGEVPLTKLAANFPKPFEVSSCSLIIAASSVQGFSVFGEIDFKLSKFGEGNIAAGVNSKDGVFLDGTFDFNTKWFDPAQIKFGYKKGKWNIGGKIGIPEGLIKGVKKADITIAYTDGLFIASGTAELTVPGVEKIALGAEFDDKGNFAFAAEVALGKLPGIKSGQVKVVIKTKQGEDDIKLRAEGKASPDFPNIRELSADLSVLYDDGLFDVTTKINYKKGRFDGTIEVGVTNKQVDEKGKPLGEPVETGEVVVYGFGSLTVDLFKGNTGTVSVRLTPERDLLVAGEIELKNLSPFGDGYNFEKEILKFPRIVIPLAGIPGVSISAFIDGGVFFKFSWQPLVLKQLKVGFAETNINEIENVTLDIHGSVGSMASAEVYMTINAGLEARVLVATLSGAIGGEAGLGISAEAGGDLDASWNMEKGLQFKEVRAFLNVTPKAVFRLTGSISIDLDLWITTINLYYHKWVFAEKELDLSGLTLKLDFPIRFNEDNTVKMPTYEEMNVQKPDFTGAQGEAILDKAINGDAEKELEAKKQEIRSQIKEDMREKSYDPEFSLSDYTEKMVEKYGKSEELKEFVLRTIEDESRRLEYERFERNKSMIRSSAMPLNSKLVLLNVFSMFNQYVTNNDVEAFKAELITLEEEKIKAQQAPVDNLQNPDGNAATMGPPPPSDNQSDQTNGVAQKSQIKNGTGATKLQRLPMFESNTESTDDSIQRKCAACEKEEEIQKKEIATERKTSDDSIGDLQQKDDLDADIQREPETDAASAEPLPFSPNPKNQILPPKPTPGTTQTPDRSDTLSVKGLWWFHAQPIEDGTKKLHPERRFEYEDSIFFDYDSAVLPDIEKDLKIERDMTDPKNPGGWLGRADKHKIKITLRGNASEEGNPAYNLSLSNKRMKAVADALKHPNIIIVKQESIFGKDKTVDFRRARRVDIVEEGVSAPAASPGDCKETLKRIMSVKSRSITFLDKASLNILKALKSPSDKEAAKTRSIVAKWFNKSDLGTMTAVAEGVSQISKTLREIDPSKGNLTCEVTGKPPVQNCSEGVGARGGNEPKAHLIVCSTMEKSDENDLTELFIHEAGHAAGFMKDFAYTYERVFRVIDTASKLKMPDGYVAATLEINNALENADVDVPNLGKDDKVKCLGEQGKLAMNALGLVDRWIKDAQDSVRELYDKSRPDFLADHVATVRTHFDPGYDAKKIKVTEALYARFEELSFPLRGDLEIICMTDLKNVFSDLGGFWEEGSSGFPAEKIFLFPEFFTLAKDSEKGALLLAEMLAEASGFIEPKHRKAFPKMAQSFSKTQDKNPWRKK